MAEKMPMLVATPVHVEAVGGGMRPGLLCATKWLSHHQQADTATSGQVDIHC